jgi:hypothetical protein
LAFVFGIALLSFIDNAEQLVERVNVRQRVSSLDEVSIVGMRRGGWLAAGAEIRMHCHARRRVEPASFSRDPAQHRVDNRTQPSSHRFGSNASGPRTVPHGSGARSAPFWLADQGYNLQVVKEPQTRVGSVRQVQQKAVVD